MRIKRQIHTIKGNISVLITCCVGLIILLTVSFNGISTKNIMEQNAAELFQEEAEGNARLINEWLIEQGKIIITMKDALVTQNGGDKEAIMDYLETNLEQNENALMYYCCFGYDGGVFPADHSTIDLDPTTRDWWTQAITEKGLIYTAPYTDFATGQMIISMAVPFTMDGEQAVLLADVTIDRLIEITRNERLATMLPIVMAWMEVYLSPRLQRFQREEQPLHLMAYQNVRGINSQAGVQKLQTLSQEM